MGKQGQLENCASIYAYEICNLSSTTTNALRAGSCVRVKTALFQNPQPVSQTPTGFLLFSGRFSDKKIHGIPRSLP